MIIGVFAQGLFKKFLTQKKVPGTFFPGKSPREIPPWERGPREFRPGKTRIFFPGKGVPETSGPGKRVPVDWVPRDFLFFSTKTKKVPTNVPGKIKTLFLQKSQGLSGRFSKKSPRDFPGKSQGLCPWERGPRESQGLLSQGVPGTIVPGSPRDY